MGDRYLGLQGRVDCLGDLMAKSQALAESASAVDTSLFPICALLLVHASGSLEYSSICIYLGTSIVSWAESASSLLLCIPTACPSIS